MAELEALDGEAAEPEPISLFLVVQAVKACRTLREGLDTLFPLLADYIDAGADPKELAAALRGLMVDPDDANRQASAGQLIAEALTRGTSHVAVDPRHPGYAMAHKLLTEEPELDRAKHIEDLRTEIAAKTAALEAKQADLEAAPKPADVAALELDLAAKVAAIEALVASKDADATKAESAALDLGVQLEVARKEIAELRPRLAIAEDSLERITEAKVNADRDLARALETIDGLTKKA